MTVRPFTFEARIQRPLPRWDVVPWLNVGLLFVLLGITGSRLVFVPGLEIALPAAAEVDTLAVGDAAVLTVLANGQMFLEGRRFAERDLRDALRRAAASGSTRLLVRVDRTVSAEQLLRIASVARAAGMREVQIPVEAPAQP